MKVPDLRTGMMLSVDDKYMAFVRYTSMDDSSEHIPKFPWLSFHRKSDFWQKYKRENSVNHLPIIYLGYKFYDHMVCGVKKRHSVLLGDVKVDLFGFDVRHLHESI